jgi:hypothetical protein
MSTSISASRLRPHFTPGPCRRIWLLGTPSPYCSPRRKQEGVYTSYLFGEPEKQVKVILLDLRYNSDEPGPESDTLGEAQWQWLGRELQGTQDDVVLIGSSISCFPLNTHMIIEGTTRKRLSGSCSCWRNRSQD